MPTFTLVITPAMAGRAIRQLAKQEIGLSAGQFKRAKFQGQLLLDGAPVMANARPLAGQELRLFIPEKENTLPAATAEKAKVVYEDELFMIVDKPAPMPSASSAKQSGLTMENLVYAALGRPDPFVYRPVNRLDKGTSGLMLVARSAYGQALLQRQLHTESLQREYLAVAEGRLPRREGLIDLPIRKVDAASVKREVSPLGKEARTYYWVLRESAGRCLVRLKLDTGRTHQIRVHLGALGCPVAGDFLYGSELPQLPGRFALHSFRCTVRHPLSGEWIVRESPLPAPLAALLESPSEGEPLP